MLLTGIVEVGSGRGKSDFVPTVNLMLQEVPQDLHYGVYICRLKIENIIYNGVAHYGPRTSVDNLITFEVHILEFDNNIYGFTVEVEVLDKLREIEKFENWQILKNQIDNDIELAKKILKLK